MVNDNTSMNSSSVLDVNVNKTNEALKKHYNSIGNILKLKILNDFNEYSIQCFNLKIVNDFDFTKNNDFYFTGTFKHNKELYEILIYKENQVIIYNENNKKELTNIYRKECEEITNIGEYIYFDKLKIKK